MKRKIILGSLLVVILIITFIAYQIFGPSVRQPEKEYFFVRTGSTIDDVRKQLVEQGVLRNTNWFDRAASAIGYEQVKPGRYKISKGMSVSDLVRMLRNGQQTPVDFVITKLRTREALAGKIAKSFETDSLTMINYLNSADSLREYQLDSNTVMSAVLPYTYKLKWNSSAATIFKEFHEAYKKFWTAERQAKADSLRLTRSQVSTVASIVDEETNKASDRPNIASVYLNRVAQGMPLQADPTLKYAMRNFGLKRLYNVHKEIDSPYNTYMYKGLPPGPICTPSLATLDAVLGAPKTEYIFFVANPAFDGTHLFTTNYADHQKYAKLYQAELNKRQIK